MSNNIVVYTIVSDNPLYPKPVNISFLMAMTLRNMGIIAPDLDESQIIRDGESTVTVYAYRKA